MADNLIRSETLAEIAEAIRIKTDSGDAMSPAQMAGLILQTGFGNIPAHHDTQAQDLIDRIRMLRDTGANYLVFGVMTDSHVNVGADCEPLSKTSARHGAFAMEAVGRWAGCDFLVNLGDNCWGGDMDTAADLAAARYLNGCVAGIFGHMRGYRLVGECDRASDPQKIYALNGAFNTFDVSAATPRRGFGYTDYPVQKVRLIALNTSDCCGSAAGYGMSYEQKAFLMYALDLSGKADCDQWQILILSHYPLDYPNDIRYNTTADVNTILSAYARGGSAQIAVQSAYAADEREDPTGLAAYSGGKLVCDYTGKNSARIIGNIHGHVHNDCHGIMTGSGVVRVATPNTCFYPGDKTVPSQYAADVSYPKTEGTAADTAVTFYAVDLDHHAIHSFACGAGTDRMIPYG